MRLQTQLCLRQWVWLFIVICPQGGFFLIIRFPNLESSAWGIKFSSGPVEQTGTVGVCFHLLLEDNPIPLMGADCTHHIVSTNWFDNVPPGLYLRRADGQIFSSSTCVNFTSRWTSNLNWISQKHNLFNTGMKVKFYASDTCLRNRRNRKE